MKKIMGYLVLLAGGLIFVLFVLKYKVYAIENDLRKTNAQIKNAEDSLKVLKAEFHYLNRPDRIRQLAKKLTNLSPLTENRLFAEKELKIADGLTSEGAA